MRRAGWMLATCLAAGLLTGCDQLQSLTEYWRFVLGAVLAVIVIVFPEGISGIAVDLRRRLQEKRT